MPRPSTARVAREVLYSIFSDYRRSAASVERDPQWIDEYISKWGLLLAVGFFHEVGSIM
jgi:hypothetical protein